MSRDQRSPRDATASGWPESRERIFPIKPPLDYRFSDKIRFQIARKRSRRGAGDRLGKIAKGAARSAIHPRAAG